MPEDESEGMVRIRDAAVELFGERGVAGTSLKAIAEHAGVSQGLVIHHFGSKSGLHRACDEHVSALIRRNKEAVIAKGSGMTPFAALSLFEESRPLLRYLVRTLSEGGEHVSQLVDDMIADAEVYMAEGERMGSIKPSATPRERVVVLVLWSLGALVLHEQLNRLLGVDFLSSSNEPRDIAPYFEPALELFRHGLLTEGAYSELAAVFTAPTDEQEPS